MYNNNVSIIISDSYNYITLNVDIYVLFMYYLCIT